MLKRLFVGLVIGLIAGAIVAAGVVEGLKMPDFLGAGGAVSAYLLAAIAGVLTGLVAGRPIWASGAKIEAGLKAGFGALLAAGMMFALRQWAGGFDVDLTVIQAGHAPVGQLPAASLPLIAALLGAFFELDNTGGDPGAGKAGAPRERVRVAGGGNGKANARGTATEEEEPELVSKHAKR